MSLKELARRLRWELFWPARIYLQRSPFRKGKRRLLNSVLLPLLPDPSYSFSWTSPAGGAIRVPYRAELGMNILVYGHFEGVEALYLSNVTAPNSTVMDVGANIGLLTIPLALAAANRGQVVAFEPYPPNVALLDQNVRRNSLTNAVIYPIALGDAEGVAQLFIATDEACHSTKSVLPQFSLTDDRTLNVPVRRLDSVWVELGRPLVSVVKIDVEGDELRVLNGAHELLTVMKPTLLLEANSAGALQELDTILAPLGYCYLQPPGFAKMNYIFHSRISSESRTCA